MAKAKPALDEVERVAAEFLEPPAAEDVEVVAHAGGGSPCAAGVRDDLNILSGWRFEEFGRDALDLVEGRLAFATEHGRLKLTHTALVQDSDTPVEAGSAAA